jgi:autotransporter passenger strand-loop-strand repeat protein
MNYQDLIISGKTASQTIAKGDSAVNTIVRNSGTLRIESGGYVKGTTVLNDTKISNCGVADSTFLSGGTMYVSGGAVAGGVQMFRNAKLIVLPGAEATDVTVSGSANVNATVTGGDSATVIRGSNASGNFYLSGGVASNFIINSTGQLLVSSGGTALDATVKMGGFLTVVSGGTALGITVSSGGHIKAPISGGDQTTVIRGVNERGSFSLSGGVASNFVINEGYDTQEIRSGGTAISTFVYGMQGYQRIYKGAVALATSVGRNGCLEINDGGSAADAVISSGGSMSVCDGAVISGAIVHGVMNVESGTAGSDESGGNAKLRNVTIAGTGILNVTKAAQFGGVITVGGSANLKSLITLQSDAALVFDLSGRTAANGVILNDWQKVTLGSASVTVSIDSSPAAGTYQLAANAGSFGATTVSVASGSDAIGSISIGSNLEAEGMRYALAVESDILQFTVTDIGPELDGAPSAVVSGYHVAISWNPAKDRSGVAKYILDINGEKYETTETGYDFYSEIFGNYSCTLQAIDANGNASVWSDAVNFTISDSEAPVFSGIINAVFAEDEVTFSWSPGNDRSEVSYILDINGDEISTAATTFVFAKEKDRNYTCRVKAVDIYGNESAWGDTVSFETTAPVLNGAPAVTVNIYDIAVNWSPATDQSGIAKYIVRIDNVDQETAESGISYHSKAFGEHTCQVRAIDVYGNASAWSDIVNFTISDITPSNVTLTADGASWTTVAGFEDCMAELSADDFQTVLPLAIGTGSVDFYNLAEGSYRLQVRAAVDDAFAASPELALGAAETGAVVFASDADAVPDAFFAQSDATWGDGFYAMHTGTAGWTGGTGEIVSLNGKNRIANIFRGSDDASILFLSDDANGDALAVDDVFTALPSGEGSPVARFSAIDEVRAGRGDDVVDLTSTKFDAANMILRGGDGNDRIWSADGKNHLFGDAGDDHLCGGAGNDVICGGIGYDRMHGGGGSDIFTFAGNWGHDTIAQTAAGNVTLWFAEGIDSDDVELTYLNGDTVVSCGDNSITVAGRELAAGNLRFGSAGNEAQYAELEALGAFADFSCSGIFDERDKISVIAALS